MIRRRSLLNNSPTIERTVVAFNILGESNSGGYALNTSALASELDINSNVMLFNNVTLNSLYPLHIGEPNSNNMVGHTGISAGNHGCDLQLSNYADQGAFNGVCYMLKAGQGGSSIVHWYNGGTTYAGVLNPWTTFVDRSNGFKQLVPANAFQPIILFLGINDAIAGTDPAIFKAHTLSFIDALLAQVGGDNYVYYVRMPRINASYQAIDDVILSLPLSNNIVKVISVDGAMDDMRDQNHFGYYGQKTIADRIVAQIKIDYNI